MKGTRTGRRKIGGWLDIGASVEFEDGHIDVDLYHPSKFNPFSWIEHGIEVDFNKRHKRGTHPGDVVKRLKKMKDINTGVSCGK